MSETIRQEIMPEGYASDIVGKLVDEGVARIESYMKRENLSADHERVQTFTKQVRHYVGLMARQHFDRVTAQ